MRQRVWITWIRKWLDKNDIRWAIAKGSNATAVFEYVVATIAVLQKQHYLTQS